MCNTTEINIHSFACDCICVIFEVWWLHSTHLFLCQVMANSLELLINPNENRELFDSKTYTLCNPSVVIRIHQLEGLLVLWLLAGELFPWELPVLVFVVGLEQLVHLLSGENNKSIFESLNNQSINQSLLCWDHTHLVTFFPALVNTSNHSSLVINPSPSVSAL